MKIIGVITCGGDAPGMNAAIRAVVRKALSKNLQVIGFERGWEGLLRNKFVHLNSRSVSGIVQQGGTILHTVRSKEFRTKAGIKLAAQNLALHKIDGLVVIGGDGSFKGAAKLSKHTNTLMIGIPATIDNDLFGTDETIGFDTAVNTAVNIIDKIRDTAISHERVFIVEVMGRTRGFIASSVGLAVGAEIILVPEEKCSEEAIYRTIKENKAKGKKSGLIVAAEGIGDTRKLAAKIEKHTGSEVRLSVLGYAQRGGSPTARSRMLASLFADKAVDLIFEGKGDRAVVLKNGEITSIELEETFKNKKPLDTKPLYLARKLAQ